MAIEDTAAIEYETCSLKTLFFCFNYGVPGFYMELRVSSSCKPEMKNLKVSIEMFCCVGRQQNQKRASVSHGDWEHHHCTGPHFSKRGNSQILLCDTQANAEIAFCRECGRCDVTKIVPNAVKIPDCGLKTCGWNKVFLLL